ncbi:MAG TPA: homoserine kinase, partial [Parasegetibacter sp.]
MNEIKVLCPATVANVVCGFDILGFALNTPFDILTMRKSDNPGVRITHKDNFNLPTEPERNVAGVALLEMINDAGYTGGIDMEIDKRIKPGSGIGSSAASAAGAVIAANKLLNLNYNKDELVRFAMSGEKLASGVKHADNIAPCIYGGITLVRSIFPLDIVQIKPPQLFVTVVHPQLEVKTSDARNILKQKVALKDAIKQWGNIAGLMAGLLRKDYDLISRSMEDVII